jgi:AcrR family transcriptional regulator
MSSTVERPMRADARRNRERVLEAARGVFAEYGHEAQMDEIARRAQVGVGTVYRHFPTKEALSAALLQDSFRRIGERARAALDESDPWEALAGVLWYGGDLLASNRGLTESLAEQPVDRQTGPESDLRDAMSELIRRGQGAGVVRPDLHVDDIPMLMCGVGAATRRFHGCADAWRRHLSIVLDGLRAQSASSKLPD